MEKEDDPISVSIECLTSHGFDHAEAVNICRAIQSDSEEQWRVDAPAWIEWCSMVKTNHDRIVMMAARGLAKVKIGPGGIEDDLRILLDKSVAIYSAKIR